MKLSRLKCSDETMNVIKSDYFFVSLPNAKNELNKSGSLLDLSTIEI